MRDAEHDFRRIVRIFIASPSDVAEERRRVDEVLEELNHSAITSQARVVLHAVKYERLPPTLGEIQPGIFRDRGNIDLVIGMMWSRFGTPTAGVGSGTEAEFRDAFTRFGKEVEDILWYFRIDPPPSDHDRQQYEKVQKFRQEYANVGRYAEYRGVEDFLRQLREHLGRWVTSQARDLAFCSAEYGAFQTASLTDSPSATDRSDLFYLLIEDARDCRLTREAVRRALHARSGESGLGDASVKITGLYDTMGRWDVVVRFRAPTLSDIPAFLKHITAAVKRRDVSPKAKVKLVNVESEAPTLAGTRTGFNGEIRHRWLGTTEAYHERHCQRFFLYVELPESDERALLDDMEKKLSNLNDLIRIAKPGDQHPVGAIIESVSYSGLDRALVFELFATCSQTMLVHELNRLIELCIPKYKTGKSTLCCFECDEPAHRAELRRA